MILSDSSNESLAQHKEHDERIQDLNAKKMSTESSTSRLVQHASDSLDDLSSERKFIIDSESESKSETVVGKPLATSSSSDRLKLDEAKTVKNSQTYESKSDVINTNNDQSTCASGEKDSVTHEGATDCAYSDNNASQQDDTSETFKGAEEGGGGGGGGGGSQYDGSQDLSPLHLSSKTDDNSFKRTSNYIDAFPMTNKSSGTNYENEDGDRDHYGAAEYSGGGRTNKYDRNIKGVSHREDPAEEEEEEDNDDEEPDEDRNDDDDEAADEERNDELDEDAESAEEEYGEDEEDEADDDGEGDADGDGDGDEEEEADDEDEDELEVEEYDGARQRKGGESSNNCKISSNNNVTTAVNAHGTPSSGSSSGGMKLKIQLKTQPDEKTKVYRIV